MPETFIHVVAAALFDKGGKVLIARRPDHLHQGGKWEFPGGKVEVRETPTDALARELFEELGVHAREFAPLIQVRHRYTDKAVLLDVWKVTRYEGEPYGKENQALTWSAPRGLARFTFPDANLPILKALDLPELYLITPPPGPDAARFVENLEAALTRGIKLVQLRAPDMNQTGYASLARAALARCRAHGARMLINAEPQWAMSLGADGVHVNSARLERLRTRPLPTDYLLSVACHNPRELALANTIHADLALVSPVNATLSHPYATPLGWSGFRVLCEQAMMPIYALGGMSPHDASRAQHNGGQGIAAIRSLWR
ncbi:MAG: Nudix family hydrolase [Gammaproteobacteria bacterium]|nr:Nudix family hydrolase [Gammaproteobacteria bacterium]MBA3731365.1 Nudix family hydrolase [Gammaproteobacteria bacterium]